jgi:hypothetical protein
MLRADPILPDVTKDDAVKIRETRRARVRVIRARVVGGSVALFLAVWSLIAVVLVTGHDPALARKTLTTSAATTGANAAATSTSSSGSAGSTGSTGTTGSTDTAGSTSSAGSTDSTGSTSSGGTSSSTGAGASDQSAVTSSQS